MRHKHYRHAAVQVGQEFVEVGFGRLVHVGHRLVEHKQLRPAHNGATEQDSLSLTAGEFANQVAGAGGQADIVEQLHCVGPVGPRRAQTPPALLPRQDDVEDADGEMPVDVDHLRQVANPEPRRALDGARQRPDDAQNGLEHSRFAAAVGANHPNKIVADDVEIYVPDHRLTVVAGRDASEFYQFIGHQSSFKPS